MCKTESTSPLTSPQDSNKNVSFSRMAPPGSIQNPRLRALLLEGISDVVPTMLKSAASRGVIIDVETYASALTEEELLLRLHNVHILGVRSKTKVTSKVIANAPHLLAIGCFCIGVDQVDLDAATASGICVFNSPYANSRSVAEMTLANIITLSRRLGDMNKDMHNGRWAKSSNGCHEVRDSIVGIIGYGHVGSQLSVLAEAIGMHVIFYDILPMMQLGRAHRVESLNDLLQRSNFVSLHVPETNQTIGMIGKKQIASMKPGSFLLNASRGRVVCVDSLAAALRSGHLGGAAVDVFPEEPSKNGTFKCVLSGCPNTLLSPHVGGSTEEAQYAIGVEVASALTSYAISGSTVSSVNLPGLMLRGHQNPGNIAVRISNVHRNVPGVLKELNNLLSEFNIEQQSCDTAGEVAYFLADVTLPEKNAQQKLQDIHKCISSLSANIMTRIIY